MNAPILSICIPTYNRLRYLSELLPILIAEAAEANRVEPRVELLISDNASTDGTEAYMRAQVQAHPWLVYRRNPTNIRALPNFQVCVERARGTCVWLFGDDDLFVPGGVFRLLDCLCTHQPALAVLRDAARPDSGTEKVVYADYGACLRQEIRTNPGFPLDHTLITANVFRKEVYDLQTSYTRVTSEYGQMYALSAGLQRGGVVVVLDGVMRVRQQRAQFAEGWPFGLCVRQGMYLWHLAHAFRVPALRTAAVRISLNLPVEILSCCVRRVSLRFRRG